ncbi:hypothetical protein [Lihuaxuella thermophila]|uniref:Uncharacterized protein n=1 Tax=Lihuaxuella thermophila TaxID=1173111 RepID=A0A1H8JEU4_9BACL|nr:hypothetical protein [Lihuaxuella thermophila]SEN78727.1 hypothetical protein SAMN05444955_1242 [Lihuaxuella thermophila]
MLELAIARALARCGSARGYAVLIEYLHDVRSLLVEHAHEELRAITGTDFGKDAARWTEWLRSAETSLAPRPLRTKLDRVANSESLMRLSVTSAPGSG